MILVDTGPIVAAASKRDAHHTSCLAALTRASPAAEAAFLRSVAIGTFELVTLTSEDLERSAELIERYANLPLGAADASIIAIAERLNIRQVLTLDRAHFSIVRPRHIDVFELLP